MEIALSMEEEPAPEAVAYLEDRLIEFNSAATGITDARELAIFARGAGNAIVAGLYGHTWGGTFKVRLLWVDEPLRRSGLGGRLLVAAEEEARRRGCTQVVLSTHSFQAPDFYRRRGFGEVGRNPDHPRGHANIFLLKRLA
jgi:GNAT superfamily N-acetyltransferase